jgi:hypothetical protein
VLPNFMVVKKSTENCKHATFKSQLDGIQNQRFASQQETIKISV